MAKQLPIIAWTNKSGFELLMINKSQTLVLPDDGRAPDCDIALASHKDAQEIIDDLYNALKLLVEYGEGEEEPELFEEQHRRLNIGRAALAKARGEAA
ncbi:hypothetical protein [Brucella pseudintermedia]|uniref:hypothetical protein n=1 Tax=Brucella pseudintermedia TaxID=370111 RepID=UPI00124F17A4|nr:hypothetical protein [Brucella pseudintermedia]KAB2680351.1 hypothetical protein F9K78_16825 [Brucella pseudintermedia]